MRECAYWLIGEWRGGEWADVRAWLRGRGRCREIVSLGAALQSRKSAAEPAAFVVAQSRPGQVPSASLESLAAAHPNCTTVLVNGPWCEGEHRPVRSMPGVVRVPWRRWRAGLDEAFGTSDTHAEHSEKSAKTRLKPRRSSRAAVWSNRRASFLYLADALKQLHVEPVWLGGSGRHAAAAEVIVYDDWEYVMPVPWRRAARRNVGAPARIVLTHFPRPDDALAAVAWGVDAMLPQPFLLSDLANTLDRLLARD